MGGLGWVWIIHTLLNEPKWAIGFLRTQPIFYPPNPTQTHPFDTPNQDSKKNIRIISFNLKSRQIIGLR